MGKIVQIGQIKAQDIERFYTTIYELDWLFGSDSLNDNSLSWGIPKESITILGGAGGTGKTRILISIVKYLLKERRENPLILSLKDRFKKFKVLFFELEMDIYRFKKQNKLDDIEGFLVPDPNEVSDYSSLEKQLELIEETKPDLIIVDSINRMKEFKKGLNSVIISGQAEDKAKGIEYIKGYRDVINRIGSSVIFVSQYTKDDKVKGSTDFTHDADIIIDLKKEDDKVIMSIPMKNRFGRTGIKIDWEHKDKEIVCTSNYRCLDDNWVKGCFERGDTKEWEKVRENTIIVPKKDKIKINEQAWDEEFGSLEELNKVFEDIDGKKEFTEKDLIEAGEIDEKDIDEAKLDEELKKFIPNSIIRVYGLPHEREEQTRRRIMDSIEYWMNATGDSFEVIYKRLMEKVYE